MQGDWSARYDELGTLTDLRKFNFTAIAVLRRRLSRVAEQTALQHFKLYVWNEHHFSSGHWSHFLMVIRTSADFIWSIMPRVPAMTASRDGTVAVPFASFVASP